MATYDGEVRQTPADDPDLLDLAEHCWADAEALARIGRGVGQQIRVRTTGPTARVALYTVSRVRHETPDTVVRMGRDGRQRLGQTEAFPAVVDSVVARRGISDEEAAGLGEFVERLDDDGASRGLVVLAPHGGEIERHTDVQAERVADRLVDVQVSVWRCRGFGRDGEGAFRRYHITSTDLHEASFPALQSIIGRGFRYAVAFHGFTEDGVLVGGGAPFRVKAEVASYLEQALTGTGIRVRIAGPDDRFCGDDPHNLVNRITATGRGGIHLEQSPIARAEHALDIADAVARVFAARLGEPPSAIARWWRRFGHLVRARSRRLRPRDRRWDR